MVETRMPWEMRLRRARERKLLTQEELGKLVGMTKGNISRLETQTRPPRLSTIKRLAAALDIPVDELAVWHEEEQGEGDPR